MHKVFKNKSQGCSTPLIHFQIYNIFLCLFLSFFLFFFFSFSFFKAEKWYGQCHTGHSSSDSPGENQFCDSLWNLWNLQPWIWFSFAKNTHAPWKSKLGRHRAGNSITMEFDRSQKLHCHYRSGLEIKFFTHSQNFASASKTYSLKWNHCSLRLRSKSGPNILIIIWFLIVTVTMTALVTTPYNPPW